MLLLKHNMKTNSYHLNIILKLSYKYYLNTNLCFYHCWISWYIALSTTVEGKHCYSMVNRRWRLRLCVKYGKDFSVLTKKLSHPYLLLWNYNFSVFRWYSTPFTVFTFRAITLLNCYIWQLPHLAGSVYASSLIFTTNLSDKCFHIIWHLKKLWFKDIRQLAQGYMVSK